MAWRRQGPDPRAARAGSPRGSLGWSTSSRLRPTGPRSRRPPGTGGCWWLNIASGAVRQLAESPDGAISGLAYSPDSAWLAWSHPGPQPLSRIRIARLADDEIVDVTDGRFVEL